MAGTYTVDSIPFVGGINWKSGPTFGHAFDEHGEGAKITKSLADKARAANQSSDQGQWLNNEEAAKLIYSRTGPYQMSPNGVWTMKIDIPEGLGQVVRADGTVVPASRAIIVLRSLSGGIRTAYPIIEGASGL